MPKVASEFLLRPSGNPAAPITLSIRSNVPDEDGQRAGVEVDLTLEELDGLVSDLEQARAWLRGGVWS